MENIPVKKLDQSAQPPGLPIAAAAASALRSAMTSRRRPAGNAAAPASRAPCRVAAADLDRVTAVFMAAHDETCDPIVTLKDIRSDSKVRKFAHPRMCLALLLRELTSASFPMIAMHLGRMDHSTIIHACKVGAYRAMERDSDLARAFRLAFERLGG